MLSDSLFGDAGAGDLYGNGGGGGAAGGFMNDGSGAGRKSVGGGSQGEAGARAGLLPVTVKLLATAADSGSDELIFEGREVREVTIVGKVGNRDEAGGGMSFTIDDGTGKVSVKYFFDMDMDETVARNKQLLQ